MSSVGRTVTLGRIEAHRPGHRAGAAGEEWTSKEHRRA
ncbi:hypothetical protein SGUI_2281 [Serinicoccus hydrothermalis]|uniref:Uncharacterized protein n=1 Tax=Serinicoccus hydrothermalis TaxID=1758689 RepID=A0A1B1NE13_9MICO|nr:hypothetical protein SGUI_2281 [Serinicoccus hydrothermalis]